MKQPLLINERIRPKMTFRAVSKVCRLMLGIVSLAESKKGSGWAKRHTNDLLWDTQSHPQNAYGKLMSHSRYNIPHIKAI